MYTFYLVEHDHIFWTGVLATVESHCNVSSDILKVYAIRTLNALTRAIMPLKLIIVNKKKVQLEDFPIALVSAFFILLKH